MITKVKCKSIHAYCSCCGAVYELNTPRDFRRVRWCRENYFRKKYGYIKCRSCKQRICVEGVS